MKRLITIILALMVMFLSTSYVIASEESDANTSNINVSVSDNSVYIFWSKWSSMKYYEFTLENIYGDFSQRFTTLDNSKEVALNEEGIYKISLEGYDGVSEPEYDMGYFYFSFGANSGSNIDVSLLADMLANKLNLTKEIESNVYTFRAVWNTGWWTAFSLNNPTDEQLDVLMQVDDVKTGSSYMSTLSVQPGNVLSNTAKYFLTLVNVDVDEIESDNFIFTFTSPVGVDVECYLGQLVDGKINGLTKDNTIDSVIYKTTSEE